MAAPPLPAKGKWTTGICGCFDDCSNSTTTVPPPPPPTSPALPGEDRRGGGWLAVDDVGSPLGGANEAAYTAGQNYLVLFTLVPVLGATLYACTYRTKLRRHFELPEQPCGPCGDCCVHHLCCFCALCQEHRELKNRQMDPVGGWREAYKTIMNPRGAAPIPEPGMAPQHCNVAIVLLSSFTFGQPDNFKDSNLGSLSSQNIKDCHSYYLIFVLNNSFE
ncbi:hypothetical protein SO802_011361 [Lithocarpus litseifolius]|uniref:Uncharacterized protein n=1 Tax=Lithocarpus litseifolius TaxID=425828 RepID=A0AAW2D356_9ROSI